MKPLIIAVIVLTGCASTTGAIKTGSDTFTVTTTTTMAGGGATEAKKLAYADANTECSKNGKHIEVVTERATPPSWTDGKHTMDLTFKCV